MNGFVFTPRYNGESNNSNAAYCVATGPARGVSATHACDATGVFQPSANLFRRRHHITNSVYVFDNHLPAQQRRQQIFDAMRNSSGAFESVAYFGHGFRDGISTASIGISQLPRLASILLTKCAPGVKIIFYGCSAGRLGGFAQQLSNNLISLNAVVFGHTGDGHATRYPYVMRYPEGQLVMEDSDPLWSTWRTALNNSEQMWLQFPFMSNTELRTRLEEIRSRTR